MNLGNMLRPKFAVQIVVARQTFRWNVRIELEGSPAYSDGRCLQRGQGLFEPALPDEAPRANDVGDHINRDGRRHDLGSLAHFLMPGSRWLEAMDRLAVGPADVPPARHPLPAGIVERHDITPVDEEPVQAASGGDKMFPA